MTCKASTFVATAKKYSGIKKGSSTHHQIIDGYNSIDKSFKETGHYGMSYTADWCATFVSYIAKLCNACDIIVPDTYCPTQSKWFKDRNQWKSKSTKPSAGWVIFFDQNYNGTADHVGIVTSASSSTVYTIEGNAGSPSAVRERSYAIGASKIMGYGVPQFTDVDSAEVVIPNQTVKSTGSSLNRKPQYKGKVTANSLNVRTWAGTSASQCSFSPLAKDVIVEVCDTLNDWLFIKYEEKYGFVFAKYVEKVEDIKQDTAQDNKQDTKAETKAETKEEVKNEVKPNVITGWVQEAKWLYFDKDGNKVTGWHNITWKGGTSWFYFGEDGYMLTGWRQLKWSGGTDWFYFDTASGAMLEGWHELKRGEKTAWFYFNEGTGTLAHDTVVGGYKVDSEGVRGEKVENTPVVETVDVTPKSEGQMKGLDISGYQEGMDLSKIDFDFVVVKSTQGTWYTSKDWKRQVEQALSLGKKVGLYHYTEFKDIEAEADFWLETVKDYVGKLPLFVDFEGDAVKQGVPACEKFCDYIYKKIGVKPLIYISKVYLNANDWSGCAKKGYPLWGKLYKSPEPTGYQTKPWLGDSVWKHYDNITLLQYTSKGKLSGWNGVLDLDLSYVNAEQWDALGKSKK